MNFFSINRSFYTLSIFFAVILTALTFFESIVRFQLGSQTFGLDSYPPWFLVGSAVMLVTSLFLLVYYRFKEYNVSYYTGLIDLIITICFGIVIYSILTGGILRDYYTPAFVAMIVTGIV